jgi:hypothetical protein
MFILLLLLGWRADKKQVIRVNFSTYTTFNPNFRGANVRQISGMATLNVN